MQTVIVFYRFFIWAPPFASLRCARVGLSGAPPSAPVFRFAPDCRLAPAPLQSLARVLRQISSKTLASSMPMKRVLRADENLGPSPIGRPNMIRVSPPFRGKTAPAHWLFNHVGSQQHSRRAADTHGADNAYFVPYHRAFNRFFP